MNGLEPIQYYRTKEISLWIDKRHSLSVSGGLFLLLGDER